MTEHASGTGAAHTPTVRAVSNVGKLQAELAEAIAAEEAAAPQRRVASAQEKAERAKRDLEQAEAELKAAKAAAKGT